MSFARYYQDELESLRNSGEDFARFFPKLTDYLSTRSTDPDVERLLEGFAFLTGRIREKLDDQLPEVTQSLLMLLWPNFLRPVPSMTMLKFDPIPGAINERQIIGEGAEVESVPTDATVCRFKTCHDVAIDPLEIADVSHVVSKESSVITIRLAALSLNGIKSSLSSHLRMYLGGGEYSATTLNLWLNRYLKQIQVRNGAGEVVSLSPRHLKQGGVSDAEKVLPYPDNAFNGYRLLQEYYAFAQKYLFCEISDLPLSHLGDDEQELELLLEFNRPLPPDVRVDSAAFQLHCVPAINLFDHDAEPILLSGRRSEYPVRPTRNGDSVAEVFSIETVTGWRPTDGNRKNGRARTYARFESFTHEVERTDGREAVYFREKVRQSLSGERLDRLISFVREDEVQRVGENETISISLRCTNGAVPRELAIGDVSIPTYSTPSFVRPTNLTRPTATRHPVVDGTLQWQLISALSLNYQSLQNVESLRSILQIFDFGARADRQRERESHQRLKGIESIQTEPVDRLFKGRPVRGMRSTLQLRESCFGSEGEMFLFASILAEFFALYATINSFHELVVCGLETGEEYRWTARVGNQPLI